MKKLFATIGALLLGMTCALAQVNVVPQVGQTSNYVARQTYSAGFIGLVPAASATDIVCIAGSASKTIRVRDIVLSGSAGTLVTVPVSLIRRAAVNTGGTAAGTTANPANAITKRDTNNGTAVATLVSYTANPTITDSAGDDLRCLVGDAACYFRRCCQCSVAILLHRRYVEPSTTPNPSRSSAAVLSEPHRRVRQFRSTERIYHLDRGVTSHAMETYGSALSQRSWRRVGIC